MFSFIGQIYATITLNEEFEDYMEILTIGSVIILRQCSVLIPDHESEVHLTITTKNLVRIYKNNPHNLKTEIINVQTLSSEELVQEMEQIKLKHKSILSRQNLNFANNRSNLSNNYSREAQCLSSRNYSNIIISPSRINNLSKEHVLRSVDAGSHKHLENSNRFDSLSTVKNNSNSLKELNNINMHDSKMNTSTVSNCNSTQISIVSNNLEETLILKDIFEGVDADSLFEDF